LFYIYSLSTPIKAFAGDRRSRRQLSCLPPT